MVETSRVQPLPFAITCDPMPSSAHELIGANCEQERIRKQLPWTLPCFIEARTDARNAFPFRGGETAAHERLHNYTFGSDAIARYKETRNGLVGTEYSTKWSPYLAVGNITPRQIFHTIRQYEEMRPEKKGISTYWAIFELEWRDYFRFAAMSYGNALFWRSGLQCVIRSEPKLPSTRRRWLQDSRLMSAWQHGCTGFPFVDANQRELLTTGWMSNRGRQNVASFLAKDLELDWRLGAEWFESLLLDYDPCSNYGNWQYAAGVGLDPRADRHFDVVRQARMYDPNGIFMAQWLPELASCTQWFDILRLHEMHPQYPPPVIHSLNHGRKRMDTASASEGKEHGNARYARDRMQRAQRARPHREPGWMRRAHTGPGDETVSETSASGSKQTVLDQFVLSSKQKR
jgi:DASH family cryptochrome